LREVRDQDETRHRYKLVSISRQATQARCSPAALSPAPNGRRQLPLGGKSFPSESPSPPSRHLGSAAHQLLRRQQHDKTKSTIHKVRRNSLTAEPTIIAEPHRTQQVPCFPGSIHTVGHATAASGTWAWAWTCKRDLDVSRRIHARFQRGSGIAHTARCPTKQKTWPATAALPTSQCPIGAPGASSVCLGTGRHQRPCSLSLPLQPAIPVAKRTTCPDFGHIFPRYPRPVGERRSDLTKVCDQPVTNPTPGASPDCSKRAIKPSTPRWFPFHARYVGIAWMHPVCISLSCLSTHSSVLDTKHHPLACPHPSIIHHPSPVPVPQPLMPPFGLIHTPSRLPPTRRTSALVCASTPLHLPTPPIPGPYQTAIQDGHTRRPATPCRSALAAPPRHGRLELGSSSS
jgi:hypothetical protein